MTRRLIVAAATFGVLLAVVGAPAGAAESFPPFTQPVVDAADAIPAETERLVGAELLDYQARSGNQIAVAIIDTTGSRSIEDYAIDLGRSWGVGQKDKDSGILLVIATRDRKLRIEVGRGLEGQLTDLQSSRIIRERLVPLLQTGDVAAAVTQGTQAVRTELGDSQAGQLPPALGAGERNTRVLGPWVYLVPMLAFGGLAFLRRRRQGGQRDGSGGGDAIVWGAALAALGHGGGFGGGGFGGGGGGGFGGGGASGDW